MAAVANSGTHQPANSINHLTAQLKVLTQINLSYHFVRSKFLGGTGLEDGPLEHEVGPVGDVEGGLHVVVGDEDADVLGPEFGDDALDVFHRNGVNTRKRLIKQDETGVSGQGAGDLRSAALAAGERISVAAAYFFQAEFFDQPFQLLVALCFVEVRHLQHGVDVVFYSELSKDRGFLRQIANTQLRALVHRHLGDVPLIQKNIALVGLDEADRHVEGRRFARAVGAEQAYDLTTVYVKRYILHYRAGAVFFVEVFAA